MLSRRPNLAIFVALVIASCAACGVSPALTPAPVPTPTASTGTPTPTVSASLEATDYPGSPSPAPTPRPSPYPTPVPVPPKPTGVSFEERRVGDDQVAQSTEITQTVRWGAPESESIEIRVYGVTECLARPGKPAPDTHGPCLVEHTALPGSLRTLLATAPASDGSVSWTWTGTFDCEIGLAYDPRGPAYHAVVLAAYSASGHSIFAIAEAGSWFQPGTNDVVC